MGATTNDSSAACGQSALTDGLERCGVTDEELTRIYNEANGLDPKRHK